MIRYTAGKGCRKCLALLEVSGPASGLGKMLEAVEPNIGEVRAEIFILDQPDDSADVVGIDVADRKDLKMGTAARQVLDALQQSPGGRRRAPIDQQAVDLAATAALDPEAVAVIGGQHLNHKLFMFWH